LQDFLCFVGYHNWSVPEDSELIRICLNCGETDGDGKIVERLMVMVNKIWIP